MKYADGQEVRLGDRVKIGQHDEGTVVCDIDTGLATPEHPFSQWAYLKTGVMILSADHGLMHYPESDEDLELIQRAP